MNERWFPPTLRRVEAAIGLILEREGGSPPGGLQVDVRPLRGGLTSQSVVVVCARYRDGGGRHRTCRLVVKSGGRSAREAEVYRNVVHPHLPDTSPRMLDALPLSDGSYRLFLEAVRRTRSWPWTDLTLGAKVMSRIARLHSSSHLAGPAVSDWDYESELAKTAAGTLEVAERQLSGPGRGALPALRRVVENLSAIRRQLLRFDVLPATVIHGDLHPGNVLVRRWRGADEPSFLDWDRCRVGSPLEDVSSWLQSLAFWEPRVRQKHDTLLTAYLLERGIAVPPSREVRDAYWLAAACNGLSGALTYHLAALADPSAAKRAKESSEGAVQDWVRVVRRADACWRR